MDESKERVALRLWNGPMTSDTVTTQSGKSFTLYNIPLYYAGYLQVFLDNQGYKMNKNDEKSVFC